MPGASVVWSLGHREQQCTVLLYAHKVSAWVSDGPPFHLRPLPSPRPQVETIRSNVIGCLNLADVCCQREIHMTYYGTGCIFHYDDTHPIGGPGFKEDDKPNFTGSYYSHTKVAGAGVCSCPGSRAELSG